MSCGQSRMKGCASRLCVACRPMLQRYALYRYPVDSTGSPDLTAEAQRFVVCGFTASVPRAAVRDKLEIPGRAAAGQDSLRMTVIAHSCDEICKGDRIAVEEKTYRVAVVQRGTPIVAVLVLA